MWVATPSPCETFIHCTSPVYPALSDSAYKRIQAARAARRFPAIFPAVAEGRLHLTAVVLLAPHLTPENAGELLAAAARKTRAQIEQLLAERFPRPDLPTRLEPLSAPSPESQPVPDAGAQLVSAPVSSWANSGLSPDGQVSNVAQLVPEPVGPVTPARASGPVAPARLTPLSPQRFGLQVTIGQETHDLLRYAESLLGHRVRSGDLEAVIRIALEALIPKVEKRKFAATEKPRRDRRSSRNPRYIPAAVRRAVWRRDQGRCTFESATGHRCEERRSLQYDHIDPVARGGQATVSGIRLRCPAHNQYEAEQVFGASFMAGKREASRRRAAERRARAGRILGARGSTPQARSEAAAPAST